MSMFCFQCQEAAKGTGCTIRGVCGKTDTLATMMDLLLYVTKGISVYAVKAREKGFTDEKIDRFVFDALFMTITNANFDEQRIIGKIHEGFSIRENAKDLALKAGLDPKEKLHHSTSWRGTTREDFDKRAIAIGVLSIENPDIRSLRELVVYGVKGMAAYAEHAFNLGYSKPEIFGFMQKALAATTDDNIGIDTLIALVLETGKYGVEVMALLDKANTESFGHPEITKVNIGTRKNPGILISGHDLKDMEELLKQTEATGVDIYTHSEMLPANYYPAFKKYKHFVGNYGSSWWHQNEEFEKFNGPILFTTNCIVPPKPHHIERIYTTGSSGYPGCKHIPDRKDGKSKDFSSIIAHAKKCQPPVEIENGHILGGFAHNQVFQLAEQVVDSVKSRAIRKFIVMAGCDGRMKNREYYTEFAEKLPKDTVILTAGCAKYRYNKLQLGDINGIPRVLDAGQCNDSYSLAVIAMKLKEVFQLNDINQLPIAYNIAWYEQKAVIVLLALLYLGVKNIHLGPTLPAFLSPNVANVLIEKFGIAGIKTVDEDIKILIG